MGEVPLSGSLERRTLPPLRCSTRKCTQKAGSFLRGGSDIGLQKIWHPWAGSAPMSPPRGFLTGRGATCERLFAMENIYSPAALKNIRCSYVGVVSRCSDTLLPCKSCGSTPSESLTRSTGGPTCSPDVGFRGEPSGNSFQGLDCTTLRRGVSSGLRGYGAKGLQSGSRVQGAGFRVVKVYLG